MTSHHTRAARGGVLVLGGGFAGSYVARRLGRAGATIVNPTNFMLYTPLLPEAAAGTIEPRHVTVPLHTMCPHADLVVGTAVAHDAQRRVVHVVSDAGRVAIAYDERPARRPRRRAAPAAARRAGPPRRHPPRRASACGVTTTPHPHGSQPHPRGSWPLTPKAGLPDSRPPAGPLGLDGV